MTLIRRVFSAVVVALSLLSVISTVPATASVSPRSTTELISPVLSAADGGPWETVLRLSPMTLRTGQPVYLYGQLAATANTERGPMMGIRIVCLATGGGAGSPYTTRNHDGRAYGVETVVTRWLFTPTHDGTYNCELRARAATMIRPDRTRLRLVQDRTLLRASPVRGGSRQFTDPADSCAGHVAIPSIPRCAKARPRARVLDHVTPVRDSSFVNVVGDVELTREYGMYPGGDSVVRTTLVARPVDGSGQACGDARRVARTSTISSTLHHLKVNLTLTHVAVNQTGRCGSSVHVAVVVRSLRGNPVTIHDGTYSNAIVLRH